MRLVDTIRGCLGENGDWKGEAIGLRRFSLEFSDREREARFAAGQAETLRRNLGSLAVVAAVTSALVVVHLVLTRPHHIGENAVAISMFKEKVSGFFILQSCLFVVVSWTPVIYKKFTPRKFELFVISNLLLTAFLAMSFTGGDKTLTAVLGQDPDIVWGSRCICETSRTIWVMGVVSFFHTQPMRWISQLLATIAVGGWHVALTVTWGPHDGDSARNVLFIAFSLMAVSVGRRGNEFTERMLFSELAQEKSLRLVAQNALLTGVCDVVVNIDKEGRVNEASPNLASVLGLDCYAAGRLVDTAIQDFMKGDDGDRVTEYLAAVWEDRFRNQPIAPLHVHFRDTFGSTFPATLRCSCVPNKYGAGTILMGITETGPREADPLASIAAPLSVLEFAPASSRNSSSSSSEDSYGPEVPGEMWAKFFAGTFNIDEASPTFHEAMGTGKYEPAKFTDVLLQESQFRQWFQATFQPIRDGVAEEDIVQTKTLKMMLFHPLTTQTGTRRQRRARRKTFNVSLTVASCGFEWTPELRILATVSKSERIPGTPRLSRGTPSSSEKSRLVTIKKFPIPL